MAIFSLAHPLNSNPLPHNRPNRRPKLSLSCRSQFPSGPSDKEGKEKHRVRKQGRWYKLAELRSKAEKLGSTVKESMSPKRKGDWKDLVLMSLSFAVYVYISQMIVCSYCAWVSLLKHSQ